MQLHLFPTDEQVALRRVLRTEGVVGERAVTVPLFSVDPFSLGSVRSLSL